MSLQSLPLSRLRQCIGRSLEIQGRRCQVIDILEDGPQMVIQVIGEVSIQADQWGEAHRRTPETFSMVVYDEATGRINPLLSKLLEEQTGN